MFNLFKKNNSINKELDKFVKKNLIHGPIHGKTLFNISMENTFSKTLLNFIDRKNITDTECYKNALIDRKLFSKIRTNADYKPKKATVLAFALSLKLNLNETNELLKSAGFILSRSIAFDVIIEFFITKEQYNIDSINEALYRYNQPMLGSI